ncbi:hypothetical protein [Peribacillus tepidiphilus]|uniref:hypothetical protein n=1 Tax=Peribacillus tepidiphilus TaxID=2652445 RepID=UPI001291E43F|nr:hypothetical protein [Peribacillus tepidiphilus]
MNPILLEVPTALNTERLLLRMPLAGDEKVVNEQLQEVNCDVLNCFPISNPFLL